MSKEKIIIDTDIGIDDAMALFFAICSEEFEIVGITSVFGNTYVNNSTQNILAVLAAADRPDIPIAEGAGGPLIGRLLPRDGRFHGKDGLGNVSWKFPKINVRPLEMSAAQFIVDKVISKPGEITIVALGPATNLALALQIDPSIAILAKKIVLLAGAFDIPGNATAAAEANVYNDPEAAKMVCGGAWDVTMIGLNVTRKVEMRREYIKEICSRKSKITDFIAQIVPFYQKAYETYHKMRDSFLCHDATLISYLLRPDIFEIQKQIPIEIVVNDGNRRGMTISRSIAESSKMHVNIAMDVKSDDVLALFKERIK